MEAELLQQQAPKDDVEQAEQSKPFAEFLVEVRIKLPREPGLKPVAKVNVKGRRQGEERLSAMMVTKEGGAEGGEVLAAGSMRKEVGTQTEAQLPGFTVSFVAGIIAATLFQASGGPAAVMRAFGR